MMTKTLGAALVLGSIALGAGPASADTGLPDPNPNPFSGLACDCQDPGQGASRVTNDLDQGIRLGVSADHRQSVTE
jgi:hypothetical protein